MKIKKALSKSDQPTINSKLRNQGVQHAIPSIISSRILRVDKIIELLRTRYKLRLINDGDNYLPVFNVRN